MSGDAIYASEFCMSIRPLELCFVRSNDEVFAVSFADEIFKSLVMVKKVFVCELQKIAVIDCAFP